MDHILIGNVAIGVLSAVIGVSGTLVTKKIRTQDNFDKLVDERVNLHLTRIEGDNTELREQNGQLSRRITTLEHDHFRIKQLELSVRMLSDALGRIDPNNATLAMVRILFASMYDGKAVEDEQI